MSGTFGMAFTHMMAVSVVVYQLQISPFMKGIYTAYKLNEL